jgi:hypothetical protein
MQEKELFAMEQPNGKGVQCIYENDGRLCNSAQIVGNITNLEIWHKKIKIRNLQFLALAMSCNEVYIYVEVCH